MKVALGSDHNAYDLKETIKKYLELHNYEIVDYGCYSCDAVDYPDIAFQVALDLRKGEFSRAILLCGTGIGMAIAAGKVPGIRAALCHDTYSAERARKSNNAQVLTMGAKVIGMDERRIRRRQFQPQGQQDHGKRTGVYKERGR